MLENQDRFWDRTRAQESTADRSGNSHHYTRNGGANDLIGSSKRTVRESVGCPAAGRRTRTTVTQSGENCFSPDRIDSAVRNVLLLLVGPGAEALFLSGAFEPIASSLAAALRHLVQHCHPVQNFNERYLHRRIFKSRHRNEACSSGASKQCQPTLAAPAAVRTSPVSRHCAIAIPQPKNTSYGGR